MYIWCEVTERSSVVNEEGHGGRMSFAVRDLLAVINAVLREHSEGSEESSVS